MRTRPKSGHQAVYARLSKNALILPFLCLALAGRAGGEQPTITLIQPNGGEVWYVGTTQRIEWTTVGVDDVAISYYNGSWQQIADSVKLSDVEWGSYPWLIPDDPGTACRVNVSDYNMVADAAQSAGTFEIRSVTDSDSDGMDDGWETAYFGDLSHDGTADTDGDTLSDYEEFMNGTDPLLADPAPVIVLDRTSLLFAAVENLANPADETVVVTNSGVGTLGEVTTSISYQSGSGWLTVTGSGPGDTQTLTNSTDISGLTAGAYTATVTVAGGGALNSEEYTVTLAIEANQAPSVDAGSDKTVELGASAVLAGFAEDDGLPYGTLTVTWSLVSGPGDASFSDENGLTTEVTFTEIGIYWIRLTASDGDLEGSDQLSVTVTEPAADGNGGGCATGGSASPGLASMFVAFLAGCTCRLRRP